MNISVQIHQKIVFIHYLRSGQNLVNNTNGLFFKPNTDTLTLGNNGVVLAGNLGNITTIGNISSSKTDGVHTLGGDLTLGRHLTIGGDISNVSTLHITASGDISASGDITASGGQLNGKFRVGVDELGR